MGSKKSSSNRGSPAASPRKSGKSSTAAAGSTPSKLKSSIGDKIDALDALAAHRARPTNPSFRIANAIMTAFFMYATYVQLNDPDFIPWVAFYSLCALNTLLNTFPSIPLDAPFLPIHLIGLFLVGTSIMNDKLYPLPDGWEGNLVHELFDVHSETGRERVGVVIALSWTLACRAVPKAVSNVFVVGVAAGVAAAAYYVPKYYMTWEDVKSVAHCHGLGFNAGKPGLAGEAAAGACKMPAGHDKLVGAGGTCPFTGKKKAEAGAGEHGKDEL